MDLDEEEITIKQEPIDSTVPKETDPIEFIQCDFKVEKSEEEFISATNPLDLDTQTEAKEYPDEQTIYRCNICMKVFMSSRACREHVRTHTGERPYVCQICSKTFTSHSGLINHVKTHRDTNESKGPRSYKCTTCEKEFDRAFHLVGHEQIHINTKRKKQFCCEHCSMKFDWLRDLKTHILCHSEISKQKIYKCQHCYRIFTRIGNLRIHMRRMHPNKARLADCNPPKKESPATSSDKLHLVDSKKLA